MKVAGDGGNRLELTFAGLVRLGGCPFRIAEIALDRLLEGPSWVGDLKARTAWEGWDKVE